MMKEYVKISTHNRCFTVYRYDTIRYAEKSDIQTPRQSTLNTITARYSYGDIYDILIDLCRPTSSCHVECGQSTGNDSV